MKYKQKILIPFFIALMAMTACNEDKFLDVAPKGKLSSENLDNPEGVEALVTSAYSGLDQHFSDPSPTFLQPPSNWSYGGIRSDDSYKGGGGVGDLSQYHDLEVFNVRADNSVLQNKWAAIYVGIDRVNKALDALREISEENFEEKDTRIAEMRFLRGHYYFDLLKNFGTFAYIDENTEDPTNVANTFNKDTLWGYIEDDFTAAVDGLPETVSQPGRANKYAAQAYLCKAHIFQEEWQQALDQANAVIRSGQYALFNDLTKLWKVPFEHGSEYIFSIEYSINDGSDFGNINWGNLLNAPRGPAYGGDGFHRPSQNLVNAYKVDGDGLPLFDSYNQSNVSEGVPVDPRLDHYIGRPGIPWKSFEEGVYDGSWARNLQEYGPYAAKKYQIDPNSQYMVTGWPWGASALNWPLLKYSEVLLWKAEALIELNQDLDVARELINDIRERAANSPKVTQLENDQPAANYRIGTYTASEWNQDYARRALRWERRLELALEGHRFYDLVRWDIAASVLNEYFAQEAEERGYYSAANFVDNKHEYLPVPQEEIDRSQGVYKQNPNY